MPAVPAQARGAVITGWGSYLPPTILTNADLERMVDTSDQWIVERTGIRERRIGHSTVDHSYEAAKIAIERSGIDPARIDGVILATITPDRQWGSAPALQDRLGLTCGAMELNAACSGFVYALSVAHGLIAIGARAILVIGSDTLSRITDWTDRNTAILFGDGSGAVVLEAREGPGEILSWDIDADGSAGEILKGELGGKIEMEGKEVFRRAVRIMVDSAQTSLAAAGCTPEDVSLVVPHQANIRIITAACDRLGIPMERAAIVLQKTGNTSAASIPLALVDALEAGRVNEGDLLLLVGFGGGMTAASAVIRWGAKS